MVSTCNMKMKIRVFILYAFLVKVCRFQLKEAFKNQYRRLISGYNFANLWHVFVTNVVMFFVHIDLFIDVDNKQAAFKPGSRSRIFLWCVNLTYS